MKFERIGKNKIKCVIDKEELDYRDIKVSDLTDYTDKAKRFFSEILDEAGVMFNLSGENVPMSINMVATKLGKLEVVVTRLTPDSDDASDDEYEEEEAESTPSAWMDMLKKKDTVTDEKKALVYVFGSFENLVTCAKLVEPLYHGDNSLYRNPANNRYYLVMQQNLNSDYEMHQVKSQMSEFSIKPEYTAGEEYMAEHYVLIVKDEAIQRLVEL